MPKYYLRPVKAKKYVAYQEEIVACRAKNVKFDGKGSEWRMGDGEWQGVDNRN
jgi:hypothetical protein